MITDNIIIDKIPEKMTGQRLDIFLAEELTGVTRSGVQKLIEEGYVLVNGANPSKKQKIKEDDIIEVKVKACAPTDVSAEKIPIDIVYEDEELAVINKANGMVVHPGAGNFAGTLVNAMLYHFDGKLATINGKDRAGIVHRIDKDTSGLIVVAKTDEAYISLAKQMKEHSVNRAYKAIVYNNFQNDEGRIDLPVGRDESNRLKRKVTYKNSKEAVTDYKVLERFGKFTLIEARLKTGRTHQIRVHMAHEKYPLLGDSVYGPQKNNLGAKRQMLHAYLIGFMHPKTGEYLEFESELPEDFSNVLTRLRKSVK